MAGLTRQHFQGLAEAFAKADKVLDKYILAEITAGPTPREVHSMLLKDIADFCERQNPGFNRERFYDVALNRKAKK